MDLRGRLRLTDTVWHDIDPDLLLLAITPPTSRIVEQDILYRLGLSTLRFLGTMMVVDRGFSSPGKMTYIRGTMLSRRMLRHYMEQLYPCTGLTEKECADTFRRLVGALYWHLAYVKEFGPEAIDHIYNWTIRNTSIQTDKIMPGK